MVGSKGMLRCVVSGRDVIDSMVLANLFIWLSFCKCPYGSTEYGLKMAERFFYHKTSLLCALVFT